MPSNSGRESKEEEREGGARKKGPWWENSEKDWFLATVLLQVRALGFLLPRLALGMTKNSFNVFATASLQREKERKKGGFGWLGWMDGSHGHVQGHARGVKGYILVYVRIRPAAVRVVGGTNHQPTNHPNFLSQEAAISTRKWESMSKRRNKFEKKKDEQKSSHKNPTNALLALKRIYSIVSECAGYRTCTLKY